MARIIGIQFGLSNPEDIIRSSAVEVTSAQTHVAGNPAPNGVFDPRMGVIEHGKRCPTCKNTDAVCPGHFGHLKLSTPVFYIHLIDYAASILKCVCVRCSRLLLDPDSDTVRALQLLPKSQILSTLKALSSNTPRFCGKDNPNGCGAIQPIIQVNKKVMTRMITGTWKTKNEEPVVEVFSPSYVLRLFERISDSDLRAMGMDPALARPEWSICSVLRVPPLAVRPSVMEDNKRMEDDLTHQLQTIIKQNIRVSDMLANGKTASLDNAVAALQWHLITYVDNTVAGIPRAAQRSGRPLKTLAERLGGKYGRFRGSLMGKRVDFSARSVITPDPNIDVDEVGVPFEIATNQSIPEVVTPYNRARLTEMVRNGPDKWPGAKSVKLAADGRTISLKFINPDQFKLHDGDLVNRHLLDGDPVLMNRQPSLHRMSMMCHRVRVLPHKTFRLNPSACRCYNADEFTTKSDESLYAC